MRMCISFGCVPLKLAKKLSSTNCYPQSFSVLLYNFLSSPKFSIHE